MNRVYFKAYQQDQGADENTYGLDADIWQKFRSCQGSHSFAPESVDQDADTGSCDHGDHSRTQGFKDALEQA